MEEKDSKGGMGEKIRGQTAYTLISPGVAVSVFLKVNSFCFVQIQLILAPTLFNFNYCLSLGFNIRCCGSDLCESERSILASFSQQAALPSLNAVIHVWLLTPRKVKTFQITLKEGWPAASTCF